MKAKLYLILNLQSLTSCILFPCYGLRNLHVNLLRKKTKRYGQKYHEEFKEIFFEIFLSWFG